MNIFTQITQAFARERLTVTNAVTTLTAALYATGAYRQRASRVQITVEKAAIRFTQEGTDPSAVVGSEVGTLANIGDVLLLDGQQAADDFKATRAGAVNAVIEVVYFR